MSHAAPPAPPPTFWKAAVLGVLLFLGSGELLFRTGLYGLVCKPDSSAGWMSRRLQTDEWFGHDGAATVAVLGDSRVNEGLAPELVAAGMPPGDGGVRLLAVPGSSPRVWAFLLECLDPRGGRWPLLVVALPTYDDWDDPGMTDDRAHDLPFLPACVGPADWWTAVTSFPAAADRKELALSLLLPWYAQRRDLRDLGASPLVRYREARARLGGYRWGSPYAGRDGDVVGARLDGDRIVGLPAGADPHAAEQLRGVVLAPPPTATGSTRAYRARWLGRIVAHEAGTGTLVVFLRLPSQVLPARTPRPPFQPVLDALQQQPHVRVLPRQLFAELERPEFFFDGLHLNRAGRQRFSALLAAALRPLLPPAQGR